MAESGWRIEEGWADTPRISRLAAANPVIAPALEDARRRFGVFARVECGLAANSLVAYDRDLRDLLGDLTAQGRTRLAEVTGRDLAGHLARLKTQRRLSGTSVIR